MAQFRLGVLPLKLETGRYRQQPVNERLCEQCDLGKVEDEVHFLCECTFYEQVRNNLFDWINQSDPDFTTLEIQEKFKYLVKKQWKDVSLYVLQAWRMRREKLYS